MFLVIYKGALIRLSVDFSKEMPGQKGLAGKIESDEKQGPTTEIILPSKAIIQKMKNVNIPDWCGSVD